MSRVTLKDVAEASGVSRATVSFVLNERNDQTISLATQERVRDAARELGYVPHGIARALAEGSSRVVVLYIDARLEGHYSRTFIRGLDEELAAHGYVLLVRHAEDQTDSAQQVLDAIAPRAVIQFGAAYRTGQLLEDTGGGWRDGLAAHTAAQLRYLAERGHERIAMALPDLETPFTQVRLRFATETVAELGLPALQPFKLPSSRQSARLALAAVLRSDRAPTAVAALDDDLAVRTLAAAHDLDVAVPTELAVIGYDETIWGAQAIPALTTVHIDAEAHGRFAVRGILGLDASDISYKPGRVVVRDSA